MASEPSPMQKKVREILFKYRSTPLKSGKTPSEQYLGRQIQNRLDVLKPPTIQGNNYNHIPSRQLSVGKRVQARYYTPNKSLWKLGTIIKKLGRLHYMVKLDNGYIFKRHINQLLSTSIQNSNSSNDQQPTNNQPIDDACGEQRSDQQLIVQQGVYNPENLTVRNEMSEDDTTSSQPQEPLADQELPGHESSDRQEPASSQPSSSNSNTTRQRRPPKYLEEYVWD